MNTNVNDCNSLKVEIVSACVELEKRLLQSQVERECIEADLSSLFPKVSLTQSPSHDSAFDSQLTCHMCLQVSDYYYFNIDLRWSSVLHSTNIRDN